MSLLQGPREGLFLMSEVPLYSGVTLNVACPGGKSDAPLGVMLYKGTGGPKDFALWGLARRATLGFVLY